MREAHSQGKRGSSKFRRGAEPQDSVFQEAKGGGQRVQGLLKQLGLILSQKPKQEGAEISAVVQ